MVKFHKKLLLVNQHTNRVKLMWSDLMGTFPTPSGAQCRLTQLLSRAEIPEIFLTALIWLDQWLPPNHSDGTTRKFRRNRIRHNIVDSDGEGWACVWSRSRYPMGVAPICDVGQQSNRHQSTSSLSWEMQATAESDFRTLLQVAIPKDGPCRMCNGILWAVRANFVRWRSTFCCSDDSGSSDEGNCRPLLLFSKAATTDSFLELFFPREVILRLASPDASSFTAHVISQFWKQLKICHHPQEAQVVERSVKRGQFRWPARAAMRDIRRLKKMRTQGAGRMPL